VNLARLFKAAERVYLGRERRVATHEPSKNGVELEAKEERERRLAKLEALTIRAFQIAYDNHHQN
jgi:hypothetical protein